MAIPAQFLDELTARCDIADVVADYVPLQRKGGNLWGLCPFHGEKTPSFSVSLEKQIYHCFGCGKGGGVINFVMEIENLAFPDAVRALAKRAGLAVPEEAGQGENRKKRERMLAMNRVAARFFYDTLQSPAGRAGADYIFQKRKLSREVATRFGLGVAAEGWDTLITAMAAQGFEKSELLGAGLIVQGQNGRLYDRFRGRVMFPIIDLRGDVIGFGGRELGDGGPKYLNSPETLVFNKGRNLFALNIAKTAKGGRIILTEGYMDTISLHQAGFDGAVASLGTALTPDHAQLLARYAKEVVIAYDGDGAGVSAAQRAIPILEKTGLKVKVLRMAGAKDPDEFIGKFGREAFAKLLDASENHIDYRIEQIRRKYQTDDDAQKVEFLKEVVALVASLSGPVEREVYGARCAQSVGISAEAMAQEVKRALTQRVKKQEKQQLRRDLAPALELQPKARALRYKNVRSARAEEGVVRLLLLDSSLFSRCAALAEADFSAPLLGRVYALLQSRWKAGKSTGITALAGELEASEMDLVTDIFSQPQSLENSIAALKDYLAIIAAEHSKAQEGGANGQDPLLAMQNRKKNQNLEVKTHE